MKKLGITGSISSGKSTFAKLLSKNKYPIFDADKIVKSIYQKKTIRNKIQKVFKLKKEKNLKKEIIRIIKNSKSNLKKLELIIHPEVRKEMKRFTLRKAKKKILIFDIPLLVEGKLIGHFDHTIFVSCSQRIRLKRYIKKGGNEILFKTLNARQMKPEKKIKFCSHKVTNNKNLKYLKKNANLMINEYE
jgi:dephospho-CoA kinase